MRSTEWVGSAAGSIRSIFIDQQLTEAQGAAVEALPQEIAV